MEQNTFSYHRPRYFRDACAPVREDGRWGSFLAWSSPAPSRARHPATINRFLPVAWLAAALLCLPETCGAVTGDLNRDGVVDFQDFFILADNFGSSGTPDPVDTVYVASGSTTYDTVHVVVADTVIYGMEPVRSAPPDPPSEIHALLHSRLAVVRRAVFDMALLEVTNRSSTALRSLKMRATFTDAAGRVVTTRSSPPNASPVDIILPHDTRVFEFSLPDLASDVESAIGQGRYTVEYTWSDTALPVRDLTVQLDPSSLLIRDPLRLSGLITNASDRSVSKFGVCVYGRQQDGAPAYLAYYYDSAFGIAPGGSAAFEIGLQYLPGFAALPLPAAGTLSYAVNWCWEGSYDWVSSGMLPLPSP